MVYTKNGSDARAEEKESCGKNSFSHWVLMRLRMIRDTEGNKPRRTNVAPLQFDYPLARKTTGRHTWQPWFCHNHTVAHGRWTSPIPLGFTRLPTFIGRHVHLEDVTIPTRQRWKTFGNRLTGLRIQIHGGILPLHQKLDTKSLCFWNLRLNRSRWRTPRNRMRVEVHLRRTPH